MGKSDLAKTLLASVPPGESGQVCSADHYFIGEDGVYRFDRTKLGTAHLICQDKYAQALIAGVNVVIVDNTNIRRHDFKYYKDLALAKGYEFFEVAVGDHSVDDSMKRNQHAVPRETLEKMAKTWQP